ncbi:MAG: hypothetical protein GXP13_02710 [Gammaproteobacteria bacterium]|nr:hypothetical protein [Gammaproteobacteria bacterium]
MNKSFRNNLREAIIYRKQADLPRIAFIIVAVVIFTLSYISYSIYFTPRGKSIEYHFISESGAITALSVIFLSMACSFSIGSLVINIRLKGRHVLLWTIMATGFGILAFDELLQFHENFGYFIGHYVDSGSFRNWNDIIVILYGVIALPIIAVLLPGIMRHRMLLELFAIGFLFYAIHTAIDSMYEPRTTGSVIFEESAKLFSVSFLALGTFVGFVGTIWNANLSGDQQNTTR